MKKSPGVDQPLPSHVMLFTVISAVIAGALILTSIRPRQPKKKIAQEGEDQESSITSGKQAIGQSSVEVKPGALHGHNKAHPTWIEITNTGSTILLVIVTAIYVVLTYQLVKTSQQQLELAQEPILSSSPGTMVKGEVAHFTLILSNSGVTSIREIKIFEDYFVALKTQTNPLVLYRFGFVNMFPDTTIPKLEVDETINFNVEFKEVYPQLVQFYNSDVKGTRMMVVRLLFRYRRQLDGREFESSKVYAIAGHGDVLVDDSSRRVDLAPLNLDEVRSFLASK